MNAENDFLMKEHQVLYKIGQRKTINFEVFSLYSIIFGYNYYSLKKWKW